MKVSELKEKLDMYISCGHGDDDVVILCKEPSIGALAAEPVSWVITGFDWDAGRVLINPEMPLVHYGVSRDTSMKAWRITYKNMGKEKTTLHCPRCKAVIKEKGTLFCPKCGQKLDIEHCQEVTL